MTENKKKILEMLAEKKISVDEAYRLLNVIDTGESGQESTVKPETAVKVKPKYLRVTVLPDPANEHATNVDRVNVRVPMSLIHAGIKLTGDAGRTSAQPGSKTTMGSVRAPTRASICFSIRLFSSITSSLFSF